MINEMKIKQVPLCVDLDHTLLATDILHEQFLELLRTKPWLLVQIIFWFLKGKAFLKTKLLSLVNIDLSLLPLNQEIVELCKEAHRSGREVVLISGSHQAIVEQYVRMCAYISDGYGTTIDCNLIGDKKARFLEEKFGKYSYDYIGDSKTDLPCWNSSNKPIVFSSKQSLCNTLDNPNYLQIKRKGVLKNFLKSIRPYQWVKNVLIIVPLFLAHKYAQIEYWPKLLLSIVAFSFIASSVYLMNDLFDLNNDRQHPIKQKRPVASGGLSISTACVFLLIFFLASLVLSGFVGSQLVGILLLYFGINILYSSILKKVILLDVFVLTGFYYLRILAGGLVTNTPVSSWLSIFCFFFFLSLAFLKRYSEVRNRKESTGAIVFGRGYSVNDSSALFIFGLVNSYLSVLVFSLYIYEEAARFIYSHSSYLWVVSVMLLFWVSSVWLRASRNQILEDPVRFALKDRLSLIVGCCIVLVLVISR